MRRILKYMSLINMVFTQIHIINYPLYIYECIITSHNSPDFALLRYMYYDFKGCFHAHANHYMRVVEDHVKSYYQIWE